jgi:hypothetical protein
MVRRRRPIVGQPDQGAVRMWVCPACKSINTPSTAKCYSCGGSPEEAPGVQDDASRVRPALVATALAVVIAVVVLAVGVPSLSPRSPADPVPTATALAAEPTVTPLASAASSTSPKASPLPSERLEGAWQVTETFQSSTDAAYTAAAPVRLTRFVVEPKCSKGICDATLAVYADPFAYLDTSTAPSFTVTLRYHDGAYSYSRKVSGQPCAGSSGTVIDHGVDVTTIVELRVVPAVATGSAVSSLGLDGTTTVTEKRTKAGAAGGCRARSSTWSLQGSSAPLLPPAVATHGPQEAAGGASEPQVAPPAAIQVNLCQVGNLVGQATSSLAAFRDLPYRIRDLQSQIAIARWQVSGDTPEETYWRQQEALNNVEAQHSRLAAQLNGSRSAWSGELGRARSYLAPAGSTTFGRGMLATIGHLNSALDLWMQGLADLDSTVAVEGSDELGQAEAAYSSAASAPCR